MALPFIGSSTGSVDPSQDDNDLPSIAPQASTNPSDYIQAMPDRTVYGAINPGAVPAELRSQVAAQQQSEAQQNAFLSARANAVGQQMSDADRAARNADKSEQEASLKEAGQNFRQDANRNILPEPQDQFVGRIAQQQLAKDTADAQQTAASINPILDENGQPITGPDNKVISPKQFPSLIQDAQTNAKGSLQQILNDQAAETTGGVVFGIGATPTPTALAAQARLKDLQANPNAPLTDSDSALLAGSTNPLHQKAAQDLSDLMDAQTSYSNKFQAKQDALRQVADLKQRATDPDAWLAKHVQENANLPQVDLESKIAKLAPDFEQRQQDFQTRLAAIQQNDAAYDQTAQQIRQQNEQDVAGQALTPGQFRLGPDGKMWTNDNLQALQTNAQQKVSYQRSTLRDRAELQAAGQRLDQDQAVLTDAQQNYQQNAQEAAQQQRAALRNDPISAPLGQALDDNERQLQADLQHAQTYSDPDQQQAAIETAKAAAQDRFQQAQQAQTVRAQALAKAGAALNQMDAESPEPLPASVKQAAADELAKANGVDAPSVLAQAAKMPIGQRAEGAWTTAWKEFAHNIFPAAVGGVTGLAGGAAAAETGPGAILADIAAGTAGRAFAQKIQDHILGDQQVQQMLTQDALNAKAHPMAAQVGQLIPMLANFVGGKGFGVLKAFENNAVKSTAAALTRNGAIPVVEGALESGTNAISKAAYDEAIQNAKDAAAKSWLSGTLQKMVSTATAGARAGAGEEASRQVQGVDPISFTSLIGAGLKSAATMGPLALLPEARTLLGKTVGGAALNSAALTLSNTAYDHFINGAPIDYDKIKQGALADLPGFAIQELLLGLAHGRVNIPLHTQADGKTLPWFSAGKEATPVAANMKSMDLAASPAELHPALSGDDPVAQKAAQRAMAISRVAQGADIHSMPDDQLRSMGMGREESGQAVPLTPDANNDAIKAAKLAQDTLQKSGTATPEQLKVAADNVAKATEPLPEPAVAIDPTGNPIIKDTAIKEMSDAGFKTTARTIGMGEQQARDYFKAKEAAAAIPAEPVEPRDEMQPMTSVEKGHADNIADVLRKNYSMPDSSMAAAIAENHVRKNGVGPIIPEQAAAEVAKAQPAPLKLTPEARTQQSNVDQTHLKAANSVISKIEDPVKRKEAAKTFQTLSPFLKQTSKAFGGRVFFHGEMPNAQKGNGLAAKESGGGVWFNNGLHVDLTKAGASEHDTNASYKKWINAAIAEEHIHRGQKEAYGAKADDAHKELVDKLLTSDEGKELLQKSVSAYHGAAESKNAKVDAGDLPETERAPLVDINNMDDSQKAVVGYELMRQIIQGHLSKEVTETAAINPGFHAKVVDILKKFVNWLSGQIGKLPPDQRDHVLAMREKIEKTLVDLGKVKEAEPVGPLVGRTKALSGLSNSALNKTIEQHEAMVANGEAPAEENLAALKTQQAQRQEQTLSSARRTEEDRTETPDSLRKIYGEDHPSFPAIIKRSKAWNLTHKAAGGKLGQMARHGFSDLKGNDVGPVAADPKLRKMLGLPPMPEYSHEDTPQGKAARAKWGEAAQHTLDAIADSAGSNRSSELDDYNHLYELAAKSDDEETMKKVAHLVAATDVAQQRTEEFLDHPKVMETIEALSKGRLSASDAAKTLLRAKDAFNDKLYRQGWPKPRGDKNLTEISDHAVTEFVKDIAEPARERTWLSRFATAHNVARSGAGANEEALGRSGAGKNESETPTVRQPRVRDLKPEIQSILTKKLGWSAEDRMTREEALAKVKAYEEGKTEENLRFAFKPDSDKLVRALDRMPKQGEATEQGEGATDFGNMFSPVRGEEDLEPKLKTRLEVLRKGIGATKDDKTRERLTEAYKTALKEVPLNTARRSEESTDDLREKLNKIGVKTEILTGSGRLALGDSSAFMRLPENVRSQASGLILNYNHSRNALREEATPQSKQIAFEKEKFDPDLAALYKSLASHDEAFQFGKTDSPDPEDIAKAVSLPGKEITAKVYGDTIRFSNPKWGITIDNTNARRPDIDASEGDRTGGGAQLYQAAFDWLHNNGKRVKTHVLTPINAKRRTSNMLSSALRWGTTTHLAPGREQDLDWQHDKHTHNIGTMLRKELEHATLLPEARQWRYDFQDGQFKDHSGKVLDNEDFAKAITAGKPSESGVGLATLQRAVLTRSTLEALEAGNGTALIPNARSGRKLDEALTGSLYASNRNEENHESRSTPIEPDTHTLGGIRGVLEDLAKASSGTGIKWHNETNRPDATLVRGTDGKLRIEAHENFPIALSQMSPEGQAQELAKIHSHFALEQALASPELQESAGKIYDLLRKGYDESANVRALFRTGFETQTGRELDPVKASAQLAALTKRIQPKTESLETQRQRKLDQLAIDKGYTAPEGLRLPPARTIEDRTAAENFAKRLIRLAMERRATGATSEDAIFDPSWRTAAHASLDKFIDGADEGAYGPEIQSLVHGLADKLEGSKPFADAMGQVLANAKEKPKYTELGSTRRGFLRGIGAFALGHLLGRGTPEVGKKVETKPTEPEPPKIDTDLVRDQEAQRKAYADRKDTVLDLNPAERDRLRDSPKPKDLKDWGPIVNATEPIRTLHASARSESYKGDDAKDPLPEVSTPDKDQEWLARNPKSAEALAKDAMEAAQSAGYTKGPVYQGGELPSHQIQSFDNTKLGTKNKAPTTKWGHWFAENPEVAGSYGPKISSYYLKVDKPYVIPWDEAHDAHRGPNAESNSARIKVEAEKNGSDAIQVKHPAGDQFAIPNSNQIKSADPITRDAQGRVIPLSERFDSSKPDILHSARRSEDVDTAANEAATSPINNHPEPTRSQLEANNAKLGHVRVGGLDISIEHPAGTKRRPEWQDLSSHYGYIKGSIGADKEHIDIFVKKGTPLDYEGPVFVVNQNGKDGNFNEHKAIFGVTNETEARTEYLNNYPKDWKGAGSIAEFKDTASFKDWATGASKRIAPAKGNVLHEEPNTNEGITRLKDFDLPTSEKLISEARAGDVTSRHEGKVRKEGLREPVSLVNLPLKNFTPEHREFIETSTDKTRVDNYAKQKIDTPIYARRSPNGGFRISDGGHRLMAAIQRGDTSIKAYVPTKDLREPTLSTPSPEEYRSNWKIPAPGREVRLPDGRVGGVVDVADNGNLTVKTVDGDLVKDVAPKSVLARLTPDELAIGPHLEDRLKSFAALKPDFDKKLKDIASALPDATPITAPLKGVPRALEKLGKKAQDLGAAGEAVDHKILAESLHDILRGSIVVDSADQIPKAIEQLKEKFGAKNLQIEDRFAKPTDAGYSDVQVKAEVAPGHIAEIQIHIPEMLAAKEGNGVKEMSGYPERYHPENLGITGTPGHKLFERYRGLPKNDSSKPELEAQMKALYGAALKVADSRATKSSNSLKDTRLELAGSGRGRAEGTTLPDSETANTLPSATASGSSQPSRQNTTPEGKSDSFTHKDTITTANIKQFAGKADVSGLKGKGADTWKFFDKKAFDESGGKLVPIDKLISNKNELEDPKFKAGTKIDPRETAAKFMARAWDGEEGIKKRAPLDVEDNGDDTYTIKDGNATAQAAMLAGWDGDIPVRVLNAPSRDEQFREPSDAERKALKIPPAWTDVKVNPDPSGRLLATGRDDKGRKQSIYSAEHTSAQAAAKFERLKAFNEALPGIEDRIATSLKSGDGREEAAVLRLIQRSAFRNGSDKATGAKVQAFGASNLRTGHVRVDGDTAHFDFIGKLGVRQQHSIQDADLAKDLAKRKEAGPRLFNTDADKVRNYLQKSGDFKVHDFRTWNATKLADAEVASRPAPTNAKEFWDARDEVGDIVAKKLGDTRKIALSDYIDPDTFSEWKTALGITDENRPKRTKGGDTGGQETSGGGAQKPAGDTSLSQRYGEAAAEGGDVGGRLNAAPRALQQVAQAGKSVLDTVTKPTRFDDGRRAVNRLVGQDQLDATRTHKIAESFRKAVPSQARREAITAYNQAGGNAHTLRSWESSSDRRFGNAARTAQSLTPDEKAWAGRVTAQTTVNPDNGHLWQKPIAPARQDELAQRQDSFKNFADAASQGFRPKTYDAARLFESESQRAGQKATRDQFLTDLKLGHAQDGGALALPAGKGDYRYKSGPMGLAIHRDILPQANAVFGRSALREWIDSRSSTVLQEAAKRGLSLASTLSSAVKQGMFSLSGFHIVTEATHGLGHFINPFKITHFDPDNTEHQDAVLHGLMAGHAGEESDFLDGLSGGIGERIKGIGGILKATNDLTMNYVSSIKLNGYQAALKRNTARFAADIAAGKMTLDDAKYLSAKQINDAFGHLNFKDMGSSPTVQHLLSLGLLAPDFLRARLHFAGSALKGLASKDAREQTMAMAVLGVGMYAGARALNALFNNGDPMLDKDHIFSVKAGDTEWKMRSVPEDVWNLLKDPSKFAMSRLSPAVTTGIQLGTGRDYRGDKVSGLQTLGQAATQAVPMSVKGIPAVMHKLDPNNPLGPWESLAGVFGIQAKRESAQTPVRELAKDYKAKIGKEDNTAYPPSPLTPLKNALVNNDAARVKAELTKLEAKETPEQLAKKMKASIFAPYVGGADELPFIQSLAPKDKGKLAASEAERAKLWDKFTAATGLGRGLKVGTPIPKARTKLPMIAEKR